MSEHQEQKNIDTCLSFWKKMTDERILTEVTNLFLDRILTEEGNSLGFSYKVVSTYSMDGIIAYSHYQFITFAFVHVFRCKIPVHVIQDLFPVVWNSPAEREGMMEEMALKFMYRVERELKSKGWYE